MGAAKPAHPAGGSKKEKVFTVQAKGMSFVQNTLTTKVGDPVALRVINRDGYAHAFASFQRSAVIPLMPLL